MRAHNDRSSGLLARSSGGAPDSAWGDERAAIDLLSDVLRAVRLNGALFFLTDATCPWSVEVPSGAALRRVVLPSAQNLISYHVVTRGRCWCGGPDGEPVQLETGDVVVIPHGDPYVLSHPSGLRGLWPESEVLEIFRRLAARELPFVVEEKGGGTEQVEVLCGFLGCDVMPFNPIFATLPAVLRVPGPPSGTEDRLTHLIEWAMLESREERAGRESVLLRIAELMFVEVVRRYLASVTKDRAGWLAGLRDPMVARALSALHGRVSFRWTLESLARDAGTSRSVLAERFTHFVGVPPMTYLVRWRMQVAARMLTDADSKVATIASAVGYESEAAFSRAFHRVVGTPPAEWRRRQAAGHAME